MTVIHGKHAKHGAAFRKLYERFDPNHAYTWDDIDRDFVVKFMSFLEDGDYMLKSLNKYLTTLRALVGYAYKDGLHENDRALMLFSKRKVEDDDKAAEIYLTEPELQALYEMPLTGLKEQVRDVFLIGCFTCQRVSDYATDNGRLFYDNSQRHTHNQTYSAENAHGG